MFVWGSKSGVMDLGVQDHRSCPVCERERSFRLMLQYKISHLWYIIKWVSEKQYALVCEVCHRGDKLVTRNVEAKFGKPKLGASPAKALGIVVAVIVGLVVLGSIDGPRRKEQTLALLAAPQKNDVYVVNVATLLTAPQSLGMYGLLRVRSVDADRVEFETPVVAYEKITGAERDLHNGKYTEPGYFAGKPLVITRVELAAMQKRGSLDAIQRP